jgi:hypothetical protein
LDELGRFSTAAQRKSPRPVTRIAAAAVARCTRHVARQLELDHSAALEPSALHMDAVQDVRATRAIERVRHAA